ncbi:MAG: hypothetical protein J0H69_09325 [Burkholderiales bacterium]|nr:hypothetical protein [Burkholderiales bacterium]
MGIALLALEGLFTPLQALLNQATARRQTAVPAGRTLGGNDKNASANDALMSRPAATRGPAHGSSLSAPRRPAQPHRPLRVVRVIDPKARDAGRLVISGRMADVCAELDRLAEIESRRH